MLGLGGTHEGIVLVMLERGHTMQEAEAEASAVCFHGGPLPLLTNSCQKAINSVVRSRWAAASFKAQDQLLTLALSAQNEKIRLEAAKTLLDRGGHGPVPLAAQTEEGMKSKTTEELLAEVEELKKLLD